MTTPKEPMEYPDKCQSCGCPVCVTGNVTMSYENAYDKLAATLSDYTKIFDGWEKLLGPSPGVQIHKLLDERDALAKALENNAGQAIRECIDANDALKAKLAEAEQIILVGQDFLEQVKEQNSLWPGEIDDFADAVRDYLKNEGGG